MKYINLVLSQSSEYKNKNYFRLALNTKLSF